MRHFGRRRYRSGSSGARKVRVQHSPSVIGSALTTEAAVLAVLANTVNVAGTSLQTDRDPGDRFQQVGNGSKLGQITIELATRLVGQPGYLDIVIAKLERSFTVPVIGTDPIPSLAEMTSGGLQGIFRQNMPGWVVHHSVFPFSAAGSNTKTIKINLAKFRKNTFRDGDFLIMMLLNKSGGSMTVDWQTRYYEFK